MKNSNYIWKAVNAHLYEHVFRIQAYAGTPYTGYLIGFSVFSTDPEKWMTKKYLHDCIDQIYNHLPKNYIGIASGGVKVTSSRECPFSHIWRDETQRDIGARYVNTDETRWASSIWLKSCLDHIKEDAWVWEEQVRKIF